jgi:hypothetical protein
MAIYTNSMTGSLPVNVSTFLILRGCLASQKSGRFGIKKVKKKEKQAKNCIPGPVRF